MATINRFFKPNNIATVQPISMEQLALVPQYMRQQHDAAASTAFENTILQADTLGGSDAEIAKQALSPLEQGFQETIDNLSKTGFTHDKKSELLKLLANKKQVQRDVIQPLEARKQQYISSVEEIKEALKDDPELMQNRLAQLSVLNNEGASIDPDTGKLKVPSINNPMYAKRLSTDEMQKAFMNAQKMVPELKEKKLLTEADIGRINKGEDMWTVIQEKSYTSKEQEDLYNMMRSTVGSDVINTIKMDMAVKMGAMSDDMTIEQYLKQTNNPAVADRFTSELTNVVDSRKVAALAKSDKYKNLTTTKKKQDYIKNQLADYKDSAMYEQDLQTIREQAQNKTALDFLTDVAVEDKMKGISETMAYLNVDLNRKYLDMGATEASARASASERVKSIIPTNVLFGSQGMASNFSDLTSGTHTFEYDDKTGNLKNVKFKDEYIDIDRVTGDQFYYVNSKTGEKLKLDDVSGKSFLGRKQDIKRVSVSEDSQKFTKAQEFAPLVYLRNNIPNSANYTDKELIEGYTEAVNNSDGQLLKAYQYYDDKDKNILDRANETMLGVDANGNLTRSGTAESRSNFLIGNGSPIGFKETMETLGFDIDTETSYVDFVKNVKPRINGYLPQLGKYAVTVRTSEGEGKTILMEPDNLDLQKSSAGSKFLYEFSKSGKVVETNLPENIESDNPNNILVAYNSMGNIFSVDSEPKIGYVELPKKYSGKDLSGSQIDFMLKSGAASFISQQEMDIKSLEASKILIR